MENIELSKNRQVSVKLFKKNVLIDIREYYNKNGTLEPGTKGISLTLEQWNTLKENMNLIDDRIKEINI